LLLYGFIGFDISVKVKERQVLIGELAERAGVTPRMVRHYANLGLVSSARNTNGYRDFDAAEIIRVRQIQALIGLGLTTSQIIDLVPCLGENITAPSCPAARDVLRHRLAAIDTQISALATLRGRVAAALDQRRQPPDNDALSD
jgi:DNA-binding transcriptional MerR regulator